MIVAVEQRQTPDEGHHHQLHGWPGYRSWSLSTSIGSDSWGGVEVVSLGSVTVLAPHGEDADQEGERGHDHLPWLGGAELPVTPEHLPHPGGQHDAVRDQLSSVLDLTQATSQLKQNIQLLMFSSNAASSERDH